MAEVTGLDGFSQEEQEEISKLPEDHPLVKALRASRFELRQEKAKGRITALQVANPDLGLTPEDFEGLTPDKYKSRVERLLTLKGTATAAPLPPETELPKEPHPSEDAFKRMAQPLEVTPPSTGEKKMTVDQAFMLMKKNPAEFERVKAAGLIEGWPTVDDKGTTIRFS